MTKKQRDEKAIFHSFEKLCPNFAGRSVVSIPGNDPPDILSTDIRRLQLQKSALNTEKAHADGHHW